MTFDSTTDRLGLPLLFVGQAQKEFYVNEAHALLDILVHGAIEGAAADPPATAADGEAWLVTAPASGAWTGQEDSLACRLGGGWRFISPQDGMRLLDRSTGGEIRYLGNWRKAADVVEPIGGSTVDSEARAVITNLIAALRVMGLLPAA
ncbi:hypothetical protein B2G71_00405 [Novosphingobium sp. PC22D]|nr:hypothetical protein B2G71_00405 [Novosphingobium sp. PC22D]